MTYFLVLTSEIVVLQNLLHKTTSWAYRIKIKIDSGYSFFDALIRKRRKNKFLSILQNCLMLTIICIKYKLIWYADKNNFARSEICLSEVVNHESDSHCQWNIVDYSGDSKSFAGSYLQDFILHSLLKRGLQWGLPKGVGGWHQHCWHNIKQKKIMWAGGNWSQVTKQATEGGIERKGEGE